MVVFRQACFHFHVGQWFHFKEIEISQELIEKRLQHKTTAIVRSQLVELGKIYNSIKDGMSARSDWFDVPKSQKSGSANDLGDKINEENKTSMIGEIEIHHKTDKILKALDHFKYPILDECDLDQLEKVYEHLGGKD